MFVRKSKQILFLVIAIGLLIAALSFKGRFVPSIKPHIAAQLSKTRFFTPDMKRQADAYLQYMYGLLYERRENFHKAVEKFEAAKKLDPESIMNRIHLGVGLVRLERKDEASKEFEETARLNPDNPNIQILTAFLFAAQNEYPEAIDQFQRILQKDPDNLFALSSIADLHVLYDQLEEAVLVYEKILKIKPDSSRIYFNLAIIESRLKRYADSQAHLERAVEIDPGHLEAHVALGLIYEIQRDIESSIEAFKRALDIDPVDVRIYHNLARLYYHSQDYDKASQQYKLILKISPRDVNAALDLAYLYINEKRYLEAVEVLESMVNEGVAHRKLFFMKGYALGRYTDDNKELSKEDADKYTKEAITALRDCLTISPNYAEAHFHIATLLEGSGDDNTAKYHLRRVIELEPGNASAYNYLGYIDIENGENLDEAIILVKKAIDIDPDNPAYIDSLGWAYYKKGVYDEALVELKRAAHLSGDDAVILEHLGDAYLKLGMQREAREKWEKVLDIEPENESARSKLDKHK